MDTEDKIRRRAVRILIKLEDAASLAVELQAPDVAALDRLALAEEIDGLLVEARSDCASVIRAARNIIRQQSR